MNREGTSRGTIWLGEKLPLMASKGKKTRGSSRFSLGDPLTLADIEDVRGVEQLIADLRAKSKLPGKEPGLGFSH
jgi:hypothetical protein